MRIKSEKIVGLCRRDISRLLAGGTFGTYMFHIAWDKSMMIWHLPKKALYLMSAQISLSTVEK